MTKLLIPSVLCCLLTILGCSASGEAPRTSAWSSVDEITGIKCPATDRRDKRLARATLKKPAPDVVDETGKPHLSEGAILKWLDDYEVLDNAKGAAMRRMDRDNERCRG